MWVEIEEEMCKFEALQDKIGSYFGLKNSGIGFLVATEIGWWFADKRSFYYGWGFLEDDVYGGEIYGGDTLNITEREEFTLIYYDNGCGEKIHFVLPNHAKVTDGDDIEKVVNA